MKHRSPRSQWAMGPEEYADENHLDRIKYADNKTFLNTTMERYARCRRLVGSECLTFVEFEGGWCTVTRGVGCEACNSADMVSCMSDPCYKVTGVCLCICFYRKLCQEWVSRFWLAERSII